MKKYLMLLIMVALMTCTTALAVNAPVKVSSSTPTIGASCLPEFRIIDPSGDTYICKSGLWSKVGVSVDTAEDTTSFDANEDGVPDEIIFAGGPRCWSYDCFGNQVSAEVNQIGTNTIIQGSTNQRYMGICRGQTGTTLGNDAIHGFAGSSATYVGYYDEHNIRKIEGRVAQLTSSNYRYLFGAVFTSGEAGGNRDFLKIYNSLAFICSTEDDLDGDGTDCDDGDADDCYWWAVAQNADTDDTGVLCATRTGASPDQCATYTAVNTTAWNTGVSCDGALEWAKLSIICNEAYTSCAFYVNDILETTMTTNLPSTEIYGVVGWIETTIALTSAYAYLDWMEICHDDD